MFAAPEDPPLLRAFIACAALGVLLLLAGLLTASRWPPARARIGRRAGGVLSVVAPVRVGGARPRAERARRRGARDRRVAADRARGGALGRVGVA
jgi:hypothetical protein